jgi:hypothetical protein
MLRKLAIILPAPLCKGLSHFINGFAAIGVLGLSSGDGAMLQDVYYRSYYSEPEGGVNWGDYLRGLILGHRILVQQMINIF